MADKNGFVFKNENLNTWFIAPSVDLTAWNVITVSGATQTALNGDYTYVPTTAKWENGSYKIWKDILWNFTDGVTTAQTADNGLNIPPQSLNAPLAYPSTITVVGAGTTEVNQEYALMSDLNGYKRWGYPSTGFRSAYIQVRNSVWEIYRAFFSGGFLIAYISPISILPQKDQWLVGGGNAPAPTLEYSLEATATVSPKASTATWVSSSPDTGFVSLTATPDEDFGYIVTLDFDGGTDAGYNLYFTQGYTDEYRNLPLSSKANFFMAGWKTVAGARVDNFTKITTAAAHTLSVLWISEYIGAIHNGCRLENGFFLSIGSYVVFSEPASSASEIGLSNPTNKIGISAE